MTVSFFLILACLAGGLLAYRLSAFAVALIAPVLGLLGYFISDSMWTGLAAFGTLQLGYVASVAWAALSRRTTQDAAPVPATTKAAQQLERAESPVE